MKKIIPAAIVFSCALAFFACDQVIVNPPINIGGFLPTVASYMLDTNVGLSETFAQTRYDTVEGGIGILSQSLTLTVGGNNILLQNGQKAMKVLRAYTDDHSQEENDSIYIVADSNGITIYTDPSCTQSQNVLRPPLTAGERFLVSDNDYNARDYVVIDSLAANVVTAADTFSAALKLTVYQVSLGTSQQVVDSTATDMYLVPHYLEVHELKTEVQKIPGTDMVIAKHVTITDLTSKSW